MTLEDDLRAVIGGIGPTDPAWTERAWNRLDSLTKPARSLGRLEELAAKVATVQRTERPDVSRATVVLMAGDHGVVAEGVAAYPQEVTAQMVANFAAGGAAINQLAAYAGASIRLVDVGVASDLPDLPGLTKAKVAHGTANMAAGPAMTREQAAEAALVGVRMAKEAADAGAQLVGTGEMGIGNSTAAAALVAAYCGVDPARVVGAGTGLNAAGVAHKAGVVRRALALNPPDEADPFGTLASVGGLEIAALAGVVLGCAARGVCVVSDGFIAGAAALAALRLAPSAAGYLFASHRSAEPGHGVALEALGLEPVLALDMRLGEGTGAALAMCLMGAACRVMSGMATFTEAGVSDRGD